MPKRKNTRRAAFSPSERAERDPFAEAVERLDIGRTGSDHEASSGEEEGASAASHLPFRHADAPVL